MTDPALDGPDAEAALLTAIYGIGCEDPSADAETLLRALNEQGVVLCDELRQRAKAGDTDLAYDTLLAARRSRCFCAPYSKPCSECSSYADGIEDAFASAAAARQDDAR